MPTPQMLRARYLCAGLGLILCFPRAAMAQGSAPAPRGAQPQLVPLSGRGASPGAVVASQTPVPGPTTGVNTLNPAIQIQGAFGGARASNRRPFSGTLSFREAIERGLEFNLGAINVSALVRQARGQRAAARSALLPSAGGDVTATRQELNLASIGVGTGAAVTGSSFTPVVG